MYFTVSAQFRNSAYSQAVQAECTGCDRLFERSPPNLGRNQVTRGCICRCLQGRKPEAQQVKLDVVTWFEWARRERIVIAISGEDVYTPDGEAVELQEMMRRYSLEE